MEANIVIKAADLTPDFADGICKVFSKDALLHIKIEYSLNVSDEMPQAKKSSKPGPKPEGAEGKKRGRKPGPKPTVKPAVGDMPKKRGPKPKIAAE